MRNVYHSTLNDRRNVLYKILRKRVRFISEEILEQCLRKLNPNRLYIIKSTNSPEKFKNISTSEFIASPSRKVLSSVTVLHGSFLPGHFQETATGKSVIEGVLPDKGSVIVLKRSVYDFRDEISKTYTLVVLDRAE